MLGDPLWKVPRKAAIEPGVWDTPQSGKTLELRGGSRSAAGTKAPGTGTKCHWLEEGQRVPPRGLPTYHRKQEQTFYSHRDSLYCGRCAKVSDDDINRGGQLILANQDLCLVQTLYWLVLCQIDTS